MRALLVILTALACGSVQAQEPLLLTTLPQVEADRIRDHLAQQGLSIQVEVLAEDLHARLKRGPEPSVLHAIDGFALVDLLDEGRLRPLPAGLGDGLEPFWVDRGRHVLVTMVEPWVFAYRQEAWATDDLPTEFDAFIDPNFSGELTLPMPQSSPSLWVAWIQDQLRQGYSEERAFAWLGSLDARVVGYQESEVGCIRALSAGHANLSVLPLGDVLGVEGRSGSLTYRMPAAGIPLRGLGIAALVEVDAAIAKLLTYLCDAELAMRHAEEQHLLPCLRRNLSNQDLPPLLQPILSRAIIYRPLMGDRQAWFKRWQDRVQGRGLGAEQLDDWLDLFFGAIFLGLMAFIFFRTRSIDERS